MQHYACVTTHTDILIKTELLSIKNLSFYLELFILEKKDTNFSIQSI